MKRLALLPFFCFALFLCFFFYSSEERKASSFDSTVVHAQNVVSQKKIATRAPAAIEAKEIKEEPKDLNEKKLAEKTLTIYNEQKQFHFTTLPLDAEKTEDPLLRHYKTIAPWVNSFKGEKLQARLISKKDFYSEEKEASYELECTWEGRLVSAEVQAEIVTPKRQTLANMSFVKNAKGSYEGKVSLSDLSDGTYLIKVKVQNKDENLTLTKSFSLERNLPSFLSFSEGRLSADKDLHYEAKWNVKETGYYLVESVLYNNNKPVAAFEEAVYLKAGNQVTPIRFDGFLFYSKKISGNFSVKNVSISRVTDSLEVKRGPLTNIKTSEQKYLWSSFRSSANPDPVLEAKSKLLQENLENI